MVRIEFQVGENAMLRRRDTGHQCGMAGIGDGGPDADHAISVRARREQASEIGNFQSSGLRLEDVLGFHAVDGNHQHWGGKPQPGREQQQKRGSNAIE
jgi:hypothetical protein